NMNGEIVDQQDLVRNFSPAAEVPGGLKLYLFLVLVLLPIDWFAPTGELLREFGAKPATLLLTFGGLYGLIIARRRRGAGFSSELMLSTIFMAWLALGSCAALLNFI